MLEFSETCGATQGCSSPVVIACNCTSPVVFLCQDCISSHVLQPRPHFFIQLDQAHKLIQGTDFFSGYLKVYGKYSEIRVDIEKYLSRIKEFKSRLVSFKRELRSEIKHAIQSKIDILNDLMHETNLKLDEINEKASDLGNEDSEMIAIYERAGIKGLMSNYVSYMSLDEQIIKQALHSMIEISTISADNSLIPSETPQDLSNSSLYQINNSYITPYEQLKLEISTLQNEIIPHLSSTLSSQIASIRHDLEEIKQKTLNPHLDIDSAPQIRVVSTELEHTKLEIQELRRELSQVIEASHSEEEFKSHNRPRVLPSCAIYAAKNDDKKLTIYDIESDSITSFDLSGSIKQNFSCSASCILPDGTILIAGGERPNPGETYRINLTTDPPEVTQLSNLNFPRQACKLVCHEDSIYSFGGYTGSDSNKAEMMKLGSPHWTVLPDMKEARYGFGHFISVNKIFILGGIRNTSIEYYDLFKNTFSLVNSIVVPAGGIVCGVIDNKIYAVGRLHVRVFDREFSVIEGKENVNHGFHYCFSNVVVAGNMMVYVNSDMWKVCAFDAEKMEMKELRELDR